MTSIRESRECSCCKKERVSKSLRARALVRVPYEFFAHKPPRKGESPEDLWICEVCDADEYAMIRHHHLIES